MTTTQASRILDYILSNPAHRNKDIAAALGVSAGYVSVVRQRHNCLQESPRGRLGALPIGPAVSRHPGLASWLIDQVDERKSVADFVASVLVDVMHEDGA